MNIPIPKFLLLSAGYIFSIIQNIFKFKSSFNYTNQLINIATQYKWWNIIPASADADEINSSNAL